jgi:dUTP pyrophosphatase
VTNQLSIKLKVRKLHPLAVLPQYAHPTDACFDICAFIEATGKSHEQDLLVAPSRIFRTGLSFEIPEGWALMVYSRSGHGFKNDVRLANCVGVIDSGYRGELMVKLTCDFNSGGMLVKNGDRIAQGMLIRVPKVQFEEVTELSDSDRGEAGLGSTGS